MPSIQDQIPRSRINLRYRTMIEGEPKEVELPFRLIILGDLSLGSSTDREQDLESRRLRTLDGRAKATAFAQEILDRFGSDPAVVIRWSETASATDYAAFAAIVIKHSELGEPAASNLLRDAAVHIAGLAEAVLERGASRVALVGGLVEFIRPWIPEATAARLTEPQADAMAGGILLAKMRLVEGA